jgi:hypothetical protein
VPFAGVGLCFYTSHLTARCPARVTRCPRPCAPARGMTVLSYTAASFLFLLNTMDSQPTEKVEGVGEDFVRGGQDKTLTKKNAIVTSAPW